MKPQNVFIFIIADRLLPCKYFSKKRAGFTEITTRILFIRKSYFRRMIFKTVFCYYYNVSS